MKEIKTAEDWGNEGDEFIFQKDYEKALTCYNKAIELGTDSSEKQRYSFMRGRAKEELHLYQEAIKEFSLLIDANYGTNFFYTDLANVKAKIGDLDGAIQDYLKAIGDSSFDNHSMKYEREYMRLAKIFCRKKEYDKAVEWIDKACLWSESEYTFFIENYKDYILLVFPTELVTIDCEEPLFSEEDKVELLKHKPIITYSQNMAYWDKCIDPYNACYYINKSYHLYYLDRFEEMSDCCDKAIELDPYNGAAYHNKGEALFKLGRSEEAFSYYVKGVELDPSLIRLIDNCEKMRMRVEKEIEARQELPF